MNRLLTLAKQMTGGRWALVATVWIAFQLIAMGSQAQGLCPSVHQEASPLSAYQEVFSQVYPLEGTIYRPRQCGRNVKELLLQLESRGLSLHNTSVLFLLHEKQQFSGGPFLPGPLRAGHNRKYLKEWDFHVVLAVQNPTQKSRFILDLDGPVEILSAEKYFNTMFKSPPQEDRLARIALREIPTFDYLQAFRDFHQNRDPRFLPDENQVVGSFRTSNQYPVTTVREYLQR